MAVRKGRIALRGTPASGVCYTAPYSHGEETHPKYSERVLALAETDAELARQMPKREAFEALCKTESPLANRLDALFREYADRPALAEKTVCRRKRRGDRENRYANTRPSSSPSRTMSSGGGSDALPKRGGTIRTTASNPTISCASWASRVYDFATLDTACIYAQAVTVPIQAAYGFETLKGMLEVIEPVTLACAVADLDMALRLIEAILPSA